MRLEIELDLELDTELEGALRKYLKAHQDEQRALRSWVENLIGGPFLPLTVQGVELVESKGPSQ